MNVLVYYKKLSQPFLESYYALTSHIYSI